MSNITSKDLFGCMTALVTPMLMTDDEPIIDYDSWEKLIKCQLKAQVSAIVVAGTTGESAMLDDDEFENLLSIAVRLCQNSHTLVIAQTGQISANKVIKSNYIASKCKADAVLIVTPYYIRTTQKGLQRHFEKIAEVSPLPIILYNVPSRTHNDLQAETTALLSQHENIIGIKEASSDPKRVAKLFGLISKNFAILSGNDDMFVASMQSGAQGVISVASNVRPFMIQQICTFMALGDIISAKKCDSSLESLYKMLSCQPNPIPVKYLLHKAGFIEAAMRLPLQWVEGDLSGFSTEVKQIIKENKL